MTEYKVVVLGGGAVGEYLNLLLLINCPFIYLFIYCSFYFILFIFYLYFSLFFSH